MCDLTKGIWEVVENKKQYHGFTPKPVGTRDIIAC